MEWANRDRVPRLIIDAHQVVLWANAAAKADLRQRRGLDLRSGTLAAIDPSQQQLLARFIDGCTETLDTFCLPAEDGDGHLLLRAQEIGRQGQTRYIGVTYTRSGTGYNAEFPDVERAFCLTQAEHRVLLQMVDGRTADEIATRTRVSVETVRSHIRSIYAKMNVASREGLFSRIQPFRL